MIERLRKVGWLAVEAASLLVVLCVLLSIILGAAGGGFITDVAHNATEFLQAVPPGAVLGVALLLVAYWYFRARRPG
ncbi:MAG: hypothetical protein EXQ93_07440 [Alphaproteobacteria bacterium]|nr:hypothetical protein [Alphaproteobacteria bacterium]